MNYLYGSEPQDKSNKRTKYNHKNHEIEQIQDSIVNNSGAQYVIHIRHNKLKTQLKTYK